MNRNLNSPEFGPIILSPGLHTPFSGSLIPGADLLTWVHDFGSIILQEFADEHYRMRYFILRFLKSIVVTNREEEDDLQSLLALKGSFHYSVNGLPEVHLRNQQFMLLEADHKEVKLVIPGGKECHLWNTYYSVAAYQDWLPVFPNLYRRGNKNKAIYHIPRPRPAHAASLEAVHRLIKTQYEEKYRGIYYEAKIKEALFGYLVESNTRPVHQELSVRERIAATQAHNIILEDIRVHFSTIELARKVHLNEAQLKRAFRVMYGLGMFAFLRKVRFEKARELILSQQLSVAEVGQQVGYSRVSEFIKEFTKYYGYSPRALRSGEVS